MKANYLFFTKLSFTYPMLDYSALVALATVIRVGSFERAARALHVTPSAVSQRVRLLEDRVGCALVIRDQPCRATETGRRLCQHVDQVQLLEQDLHGSLPALATQDISRATIPVAVNADSLATWLAPAIAAFAAEQAVLMEMAVDDQDHTAEWLRNGTVLAAVTSTARPASGCHSRPLGAMRYIAAASPAFMQRYFSEGIDASSLALAPSLVFNLKDTLQERWVRRLCHRHVDLPRHMLPSPQAFATAALAGMGWGLHPQALIAPHLAAGTLVALLPDSALDVPLYWHTARASPGLLEKLSQAIVTAAHAALLAA
ncbi:MAG: hypothetical protein RLZZ237_2463 [Pseudomonadota bacterium]|jgi:LysR family transcriptional regulator (chromosome initiation inhibitor)